MNGKRVNIPSYRVKEGDVIEVREKSKQMAALLEAVQLAERDVPDYIEADHSKMTATFVRAPPLWATCRTRLSWNRTWSSNSTPRTKSFLLETDFRGRHLGGPFSFLAGRRR